MSLKIPVTPPGIDPGTVRLVAQRLNHYATAGPSCLFLGPLNCSGRRKWVKYDHKNILLHWAPSILIVEGTGSWYDRDGELMEQDVNILTEHY